MTIKVNFSDFWGGFDYKNHIIYRIFKKYFDIEISDDPDFLIFSSYSNEHLKYDCVKIQYLAENLRPDYSVSDFAIGFDYDTHDNYLRLPLYVSYFDDDFTPEKLLRIRSEEEIQKIYEHKTKFCCFMVSNPR